MPSSVTIYKFYESIPLFCGCRKVWGLFSFLFPHAISGKYSKDYCFEIRPYARPVISNDVDRRVIVSFGFLS